MLRKDNPMKSWFDPALQELLESAQYQEICDGLAGVHGKIKLYAIADV